MRGKRSKQYRKLMQQYGLTFGFREPYQVLVDVGMLEAAVVQFKMELATSLTRTLHGEVKPMITQCTIRHLYNIATAGSAASASSKNTTSISSTDKTAMLDVAKTFEKRRCGHHELEAPLSTLECLQSVIDPKSVQTNKHRYVIACQDDKVRDWARGVRGVPSVYVKRSVMIMEPMTEASINVKEGAEREKLRAGIKRKRGPSQEQPKVAREHGVQASPAAPDGDAKKRKIKGPKQPNPLSVRKAKPRTDSAKLQATTGEDQQRAKRRRKRKPAEMPNDQGLDED